MKKIYLILITLLILVLSFFACFNFYQENNNENKILLKKLENIKDEDVDFENNKSEESKFSSFSPAIFNYNYEQKKYPSFCERTDLRGCYYNKDKFAYYMDDNKYAIFLDKTNIIPAQNTKCSKTYSWCVHDYWQGAQDTCKKMGMRLTNKEELYKISKKIKKEEEIYGKTEFSSGYYWTSDEFSVHGAYMVILNEAKLDIINKNNNKVYALCVYTNN